MTSNRNKGEVLNTRQALILLVLLSIALVYLKTERRAAVPVLEGYFSSSGLLGSDYVLDIKGDLEAMDLQSLGRDIGL